MYICFVFICMCMHVCERIILWIENAMNSMFLVVVVVIGNIINTFTFDQCDIVAENVLFSWEKKVLTANF